MRLLSKLSTLLYKDIEKTANTKLKKCPITHPRDQFMSLYSEECKLCKKINNDVKEEKQQLLELEPSMRASALYNIYINVAKRYRMLPKDVVQIDRNNGTLLGPETIIEVDDPSIKEKIQDVQLRLNKAPQIKKEINKAKTAYKDKIEKDPSIIKKIYEHFAKKFQLSVDIIEELDIGNVIKKAPEIKIELEELKKDDYEELQKNPTFIETIYEYVAELYQLPIKTIKELDTKYVEWKGKDPITEVEIKTVEMKHGQGNFFTLREVLQKLSAPKIDLGGEEILTIEEFYEKVSEYNGEHPNNKLLPVVAHGAVPLGIQEEKERIISPEFMGKTETVHMLERPIQEEERGTTVKKEEPERSSELTPEHKKSGYNTLWAWNDWEKEGKKHVGVKTVFADRIEELQKNKKQYILALFPKKSKELEHKINAANGLIKLKQNEIEEINKNKEKILSQIEETDPKYIKIQEQIDSKVELKKIEIGKLEDEKEKLEKMLKKLESQFKKFTKEKVSNLIFKLLSAELS